MIVHIDDDDVEDIVRASIFGEKSSDHTVQLRAAGKNLTKILLKFDSSLTQIIIIIIIIIIIMEKKRFFSQRC